ncbi:Hypothetical protein A7982_00988 [Minicystis rosea]|nr:Hypothetical protein A7982_00988 [Minicystis rosea]
MRLGVSRGADDVEDGSRGIVRDWITRSRTLTHAHARSRTMELHDA